MAHRSTPRRPRASQPHAVRDAAAFSPERLARDFGAAAPLCRQGVAALVLALQGAGERGRPLTRRALAGWRERYGAVCGYDLEECAPRGPQAALAAAFGLPPVTSGTNGALLLFAVHSYFALLLQLLCLDVLAASRGEPSPVARLRGPNAPGEVQRLLEELARGALFPALGVEDLLEGGIFSWYAEAQTPGVEALCLELAAALGRYDPQTLDTAAELDLLKGLYQALFPRRLRHGLGEYYTPDWLAERVLTQVGYQGDPESRLLDPACGSGTFLVAALRRARRAFEARAASTPQEERAWAQRVLRNVVGFDLNPLAVMAARVNYLIALRDVPDLLRQPGGALLHIPVYLCDSILAQNGALAQLCAPTWAALGPLFERAAQPPTLPPFDFIAGNPPWVLWDHLPPAYRAATRPLWEHYGLFTLSGKDARHGGGKKDLAALMLYACADAYLRHGGRLGFVITQTLFQTRGAGDGFRRFRLGQDGAYLGVQHVEDLVALQPFPGTNNWTCTVVLEKGVATRYPVPYHRHTPGQGTSDPKVELLQATPATPLDLRSPWLLQPRALASGGELAAMTIGSGPRSAYHAHAGAYSGGQNGVYWLEVLGHGSQEGLVRVRNLASASKGGLAQVEREVEAALLYPLLRWGDVQPFAAAPSAHLLLVQDPLTRRGLPESVLSEHYPRALSYLREFEVLLRARAAYRRYFRPDSHVPFYSMYDIGPYTLSPWKVVWRRMDRKLGAAVVGPTPRPVIPQETCVLIAVEEEAEAHYLCALLNSAVLRYLLQGQSVQGGKSFGTPGMLAQVRLPTFQASDPLHRALALLSRQAHSLAPVDAARRLLPLRSVMDARTAELYGVGTAALQVMQGAVYASPSSSQEP